MVGDATPEGRWGKDVADLECLTTALGTYRSLKMEVYFRIFIIYLK